MNNPLNKFAINQRAIPDRWIWLGIGAGLALLHLILIWRLLHQMDQVVIQALFWVAILGLFANRRYRTRRDRLSRYLGLLLLGFIVAGSFSMTPGAAWFARLFPALTILSLGLLFSVQLKQHWRIGLLLIPLMVPRGMVERLTEQAIGRSIQILTAQFAAFVLHYLGFDAIQQHTTITLSQGTVDVLFRCTGIPLLILLLQLFLLFLLVFSLSWSQQVRLMIVAIVIAFLFSGLRVALMAVVVRDPVAFAYWHGGNGSQIFSTGAIVLFGWFCQRLLPRI